MEACGIAVKENCCNCSLCSSSCPFDAIDIVDEAAKIDIDKCQYCGLCYSVCPSNVISSEYFDMESLIDDLKAAMETSESKELVLVCRGTAEKLKIPEAIQLKLPCLGRVPIQFYFEAIILGIEKIHLYACDDDYCRYEKGSKNAWRRALLAQRLLDQFGYRPIIEFQRSSLKVSVNRNRCIGCGNCFYVCPYDAIHLDSPGIARIEIDSCLGCGRCVPVCPSFAISLEGSERDKISSAISNFSSQQISPKILVFYCKWCEFKLNPRENVQLIELPCSGRIDP
jgi:Fe-S-cluster-containing hydrogenase component 2